MVQRERGDGGCVQNFKGLDKSVKHFDAGDIQNIELAKIDKQTLYIKAYCLASMKKQRYHVYICMTVAEDDSTTIDYAYCQCPIGLAQSCSHIGGLLFAIANRKIQPAPMENEESCTSALCQWKVPRTLNQKPVPFTSLDFSKPKVENITNLPSKTSSNSMSLFEPRHTSDRVNDIDYSLTRLRKLKELFPQTGMSCLWNIPDVAPSASLEEEVITSVHPLQLKMEKMVFTDENFPPAIIEDELSEYVEQNTRDQRKCQIWKDLHIGRITSSLFGDVMKSSNPNSLVKQILEGSNLDRYSRLPESVQWGIDMEDKARNDYITFQKAVNDNIQVIPAGLTLYPTHSFLGASSDGKVVDDSGIGILEIKCPFSIGGVKVNTMEIDEIMAIESASFYLEKGELGPNLKKTSKYYAQVQGEMALMGLPWCDFVVWTSASKNNIFIERILFDIEFCNIMLPTLVNFYMNHIFPKIYKK